ncbi:hypothetical protein KKC88_05320 [Patescibacteria group bacterium]|nr:hypothetical protein [Patescibacteria group bacterium]MBU1673591.1 hypothetical protein [Patescibacteria group bacterium]MBU1964047.1 hypothetical protein [Patescibacteria group bacterium]
MNIERKIEVNPETLAQQEAERIFNIIKESGLAGTNIVDQYYKMTEELGVRINSDAAALDYTEKSIDRMNEAICLDIETETDLKKERTPEEISKNILLPIFNGEVKTFTLPSGEKGSLEDYLKQAVERFDIEIKLSKGKLIDFFSDSELDEVSKKVHPPNNFDKEAEIPIIKVTKPNGQEQICPIFCFIDPSIQEAGFCPSFIANEETTSPNMMHFIELNFKTGTYKDLYNVIYGTLIHEIDHYIHLSTSKPKGSYKRDMIYVKKKNEGEKITVDDQTIDLKESEQESLAAEALANKAVIQFQFLQAMGQELGEKKYDATLLKYLFLDDMFTSTPDVDVQKKYYAGPMMAMILEKEDPKKFFDIFYNGEWQQNDIDYTRAQEILTDQLLKARKAARRKELRKYRKN